MPPNGLRYLTSGRDGHPAWEQETFEARRMLKNAAESRWSGARFVRRFCDKTKVLLYS
jgi:hypothetical protein